jgi:hypothetical protein
METEETRHIAAGGGDAREAETHLGTALSLCREIGARVPEGHALLELGRVAGREGDARSALERAEEAIALWREAGERTGLVGALVQLGRLRAKAEDAIGARSALQEASALAGEMGLQGPATLAKAHLAAITSEPKHALAAFGEHQGLLTYAEKMEVRFLPWQTAGDREHLEEAHRLLCYLRDHAPEEHRETMIANVPLHREIMKAWVERSVQGDHRSKPQGRPLRRELGKDPVGFDLARTERRQEV